MKTFVYRKSCKNIHWGCCFDSITELKFYLSVADDYTVLRSHIPIFYDPRTKVPTNYIRDNIRRYTPDFLIRHREAKEAFLVEVKPRAFEGEEQLVLRQEVAENYIRWKGYDWKFKIVFDDEIQLSYEQEEALAKCRKSIGLSAHKLRLKELNDIYDQSKPSLFNAPSSALVRFAMFGDEKFLHKH